MNIFDAIQSGAVRLHQAGVEIPERTAEWLWLHASGMSKTNLLLQWHEPAQEDMLTQFWSLIDRRTKREPLQYILQQAEFCGLLLHVDARVLIPRPETELLVAEAEVACQRLRGLDSPLTVIDVGTGSGAIIIALASAIQSGGAVDTVRFLGVDTSADALDVARGNAASLGVAGCIEWVHASLLQGLPSDVNEIHLLLCNPPYIPYSQASDIQPEVVEYEPHAALFAADDGLQVYAQLLIEAQSRLHHQGVVIFEVGIQQVSRVTAMIHTTWPDIHIVTRADAQGIPRVIIGTRNAIQS